MEAEWDITAPSAGHQERLRTQRLVLSKALSTVHDRSMPLAAWKGSYPIVTGQWVNSDRSPILGGPLNCTAIKDSLISSATGTATANNNNSSLNNGGVNNTNSNNNSIDSGAMMAANAATSQLALSQQVIVTALHNGTLLIYNTLNQNKSTCFVPADIKTTNANGMPLSAASQGGNYYGTSNQQQQQATGKNNNGAAHISGGGASTAAGGGGTTTSSTSSTTVEHTVASKLAYGTLAAVSLSPLSYRSDNQSKMAMAWVFQDAIACCQLDTSKRDPNIEAVQKIATIPSGLMASGALLAFSNLFEWGFSLPPSPAIAAAMVMQANNNATNGHAIAGNSASSSASTTVEAAQAVGGVSSSSSSSAAPSGFGANPMLSPKNTSSSDNATANMNSNNAGSGGGASFSEADISPVAPPRTRFLAAIVSESETSTSRLMIAVQTSNVASEAPPATGLSSSAGGGGAQSFSSLLGGSGASSNNNNANNNGGVASLLSMAPIQAAGGGGGGGAAATDASFWGTIHGEVIFMEWIANPRPSHLVRRAAILAEKEAQLARSRTGGNAYDNNTNYRGRGYYNNNNRRNNNRFYNDDDEGGGGGGYRRFGNHDNNNGGNATRRYEDFLPSGLQPEGGPALLLLGTSDCRLLLVQVYVSSFPSSSPGANNSTSSSNNSNTNSGKIPASCLSWRVVSETLAANNCPTQHMSAFSFPRTYFKDSSSALSTDAAMATAAAAESANLTAEGSEQQLTVNSNSSSSKLTAALTAGSLTTSFTTDIMVSFVGMGNMLQNASLELTWPLMTTQSTAATLLVANNNASSSSSAAAAASNASSPIGAKRAREDDGSANAATTSASTIVNTSPVPYFPTQHLLQLQPLASLSTDDFYIQNLKAGVFGNLPVFTLALSTGLILILDGRSLTPLFSHKFERNKHSSPAQPLQLLLREQPPMIAVIDDENICVLKYK